VILDGAQIAWVATAAAKINPFIVLAPYFAFSFTTSIVLSNLTN
jgi:hypothetical protein